jgi:hypothetical protein
MAKRLVYRSGNKYLVLKLRMGMSESSCQSSRVPKMCDRASEDWSGARSALLNLGIQRAHRVAFGRSARAKKSKRQTIFLAAQTGRSHWISLRRALTHTAMSDPGGPAGPAVPPPAPAATVWPQGADPSKAKQSKLSFARASWLEQNAARFAEMSAAADAARAAEMRNAAGPGGPHVWKQVGGRLKARVPLV